MCTFTSAFKKISVSCSMDTGRSNYSRLFRGFALSSLICIFKPIQDSTLCSRWAFLLRLTAILILALSKSALSASKNISFSFNLIHSYTQRSVKLWHLCKLGSWGHLHTSVFWVKKLFQSLPVCPNMLVASTQTSEHCLSSYLSQL